MDRETLRLLEKANQLLLTEEQATATVAFLQAQHKEIAALDAIDTENVTRMVHVLPVPAALREDVAEKNFERDDLQAGAPETMDGYWQVPRLVE